MRNVSKCPQFKQNYISFFLLYTEHKTNPQSAYRKFFLDSCIIIVNFMTIIVKMKGTVPYFNYVQFSVFKFLRFISQ